MPTDSNLRRRDSALQGGYPSAGKPSALAAAKDENTFMFRNSKNNAKAIKKFIDEATGKSRAPQAAVPATRLSYELQKLAQLKEQGILSESEFQAAKNKLIG